MALFQRAEGVILNSLKSESMLSSLKAVFLNKKNIQIIYTHPVKEAYLEDQVKRALLISSSTKTRSIVHCFSLSSGLKS